MYIDTSGRLNKALNGLVERVQLRHLPENPCSFLTMKPVKAALVAILA